MNPSTKDNSTNSFIVFPRSPNCTLKIIFIITDFTSFRACYNFSLSCHSAVKACQNSSVLLEDYMTNFIPASRAEISARLPE